jgi:uncharacterized alkaline shock family protein YloU
MGYAKTSKKNPGGQRRAKKSEYAMQLTEKQKVKFVYGILEKQFRAYYEKAARAGARALAKGVKAEITEGVISVRLIIIMKYGYNIPETTIKVQEKVKSALETMIGLEVAEVNVSVADVALDNDK